MDNAQHEKAVREMYDRVGEDTREDLGRALQWASNTLLLREGGGHVFQVHPGPDRDVMCTFSKPSWGGEHSSRPMDLGSEAVVMAVCEYINGL